VTPGSTSHAARSGPTAADPLVVYRRIPASLPLLVARRAGADVLTRGPHRRFASARPTRRARGSHPRRRSMYGRADPTRLLVHSGGEGFAGFGEVDPEGSRLNRRQSRGCLPRTTVSSDGRFRASPRPATGTSTGRARDARSDRVARGRRLRHGRRRIGTSERPGVHRTGRRGRDVALPVGPPA
jgi:hypothetical protein